jgi:hypothetical protein
MQGMNEQYRSLISSNRVSPQTRAILQTRLEADDSDYVPTALTQQQFVTLRSVFARVIPQPKDAPAIDLAARLDRNLASGKVDGWRYATLPSDASAYSIGLGLLDDFAKRLSGKPFDAIEPSAQDALIDSIASGRLHSQKLDLKRWFEDLRANATEIYVSHPETLARMGYSGIADENGLVQLGVGQVEPWEPKAE